jgi:hypothetical protein
MKTFSHVVDLCGMRVPLKAEKQMLPEGKIGKK